MRAVQPVGREGAEPGLPSSPRKVRQREEDGRAWRSTGFYAVSQSPRGPKTFLAHEAPKHSWLLLLAELSLVIKPLPLSAEMFCSHFIGVDGGTTHLCRSHPCGLLGPVKLEVSGSLSREVFKRICVMRIAFGSSASARGEHGHEPW